MNTALPSLIASIFFYISSIYYGRAKMANEREKEDVMTKASQYKFDDAHESVKSYGAYEFNESSRMYQFEKGGSGFVQKTRSAAGSLQPKRPARLGDSTFK